MANDGGPAFPQVRYDNDEHPIWQPGVSVRDYFAAAALNGLLASAGFVTATVRITFEHYSACAYHHADAMLAERAK